MNWQQANEDYQRIERAIHYLDQHKLEQPGLSDVAGEIGLSEFHFQKLFTRWAGVSPKRFLQFLTKEHAKEMLAQSASLLDVTYRTGLSSPGRLHDLFVTWEAVTPGEYKQHGAGLDIVYGIHPSPFGSCLLATTSRGICSLYFFDGQASESALRSFHAQWRLASIERDQAATRSAFEKVFSRYNPASSQSIHLHLVGTNFQLKVWEALLKIPMGSLVSYEQLAGMAGSPRSARAVGSTLSRNQVALLIPCHRVIRKVGGFGDYRWGADRKRAILGWEMAQVGA